MTILGSSISLLAFIYGACVGSFLNVVSLRYVDRVSSTPTLPTTVRGRSMCPNCKKALRWWELLPVISFLALRGRCARCHHAIAYQYPLIELLMGILAWRLVIVYPYDVIALALATVIIAILVVLAVIDFRTFLLPDGFILGLCAIVLVWVLYQAYSPSHIIGGVGIGAGFLLLLWILTRGQGIGLGDVKLMVPLGAYFGPWSATVVLFLAFCIGGIVGIFLLARRSATLKTAVPFGPFLIGAALLLILFPQIPSHLFYLLWAG